MKIGTSINGGLFKLALAALLGLSGLAQANVYDAPTLHPAIPLVDESGEHVLDSGKPYSSKRSCGGCHDYESITHAFHIEQGREETRDDFGALRGLPQLVGPGYFGGYNCMGTSNSTMLAKKSNASADDFADYGSAGIVKRCATCHSGGGWMEKDRNGNRYDEVDPATVAPLDGDYFNRGTDTNNDDADSSVVSQWDWQKSGVVENDCLLCHADFTALKRFDTRIGIEPGRHDHLAADAECGFDTTGDTALDRITDPVELAGKLRSDMIGTRALFRYGNTAIFEYLNLNTDGNSANDIAAVAFARTDSDASNNSAACGITVDNSEIDVDGDGMPLFSWNAAAFDVDRKISIPMLRFGANDNCMACHSTSNSRRGFYGFGEGADATYDEDGVLVEDYRDDIHKGKSWVESGESRTIENCNVCHSREYFKPSSANVSLDANHNFLKGNSDMDVRNDLDYNPNAKSCEYCHNDAVNSDIANPSGYSDMLSAHKAQWLAGGDMFGYPADTLERITQTHLDVVSCQACHITGKTISSQPYQPMYRYREASDGRLKIVPYKPKTRIYWKDKNSDRVLSSTESGEVAVDTTPSTYEEFVTLKGAYDQLMVSKGVANADMVQVIAEINQYIISHNTSPAVSSVQCTACHNTKSDGSFSSLISPDGLLGTGNSAAVTTVVDPRLVDEGLVVLDMPYMNMDAAGAVTENVLDVLYHSIVDPSMSGLGSADAAIATGTLDLVAIADVLAEAGISADDALLAQAQFSNANAYEFQANHGDAAIRKVLILVESNAQSDLLFPTYFIEVALADSTVTTSAAAAGLGGLVSGLYSLRALDSSVTEVSSFSGAQVLVKLPYGRTNTNLDQVRIITSSDGANWTVVDPSRIVALQPQSDSADGYIVFMTDHFSYYAVADSVVTAIDTGTTEESSGGGSAGLWLLLMGLLALMGRGFEGLFKGRGKPGYKEEPARGHGSNPVALWN